VLFERGGLKADSVPPALGTTVGSALLAPHRSYLRAISPLLDAGLIKGMAHITGGGITENLPRVLPDGCAATIHPGTWTELPIFGVLSELGSIPRPEMFRAFNMGIGLIVVCEADRAHDLLERLAASGEREARIIGGVTAGNRAVRYVPAL
jgi:phosphoribosylformylglycinamidine cyclo-ligase